MRHKRSSRWTRRQVMAGSIAALGLGIAALRTSTDATEHAAGPGDGAGKDNPFTRVRSKKGLQVQMIDDAVTLGVQHAGLNVNLSELVAPEGVGSAGELANTLEHRYAGEVYRFRRDVLERHDALIRPLSERGVLVYLILLVYEHPDASVNRRMLHPAYDRAAPNHLGAFNTVTPEGRRWLAAAIDLLAQRYAGGNSPHGCVAGYIVGNEVNSHWFWSNRGRVAMPEFARDYEQAVRITQGSVRGHSTWARVYVSLEHHWNMRYEGGDEQQSFAGRPFLEEFARLARAGGDYDWHVAFHPYPETLFEPRFWNDRSATDADDTPRITFRNLPVLTRFLGREELRHEGLPRRVILSEQGFHTPDGPDGESVQAAAYCYAYRLVRDEPGIDAFILHRHVDHAQEGGLRLGLWTNQAGSVATPDRRKKIHECFRAADTVDEGPAFEFALPIVGLRDWPAEALSPKR